MSSDLQPVHRILVGTPEQVRNVLVNADRRGHLVSMTPARRVGRRRVRVDLVLMERPAPVRPAERPAKPRSRRRPGVVPTVAAVSAVVVLTAFGVALVILVHWVMAHLAVVLGVLAALVVLAGIGAARTGTCVGIHCAGCGHR